MENALLWKVPLHRVAEAHHSILGKPIAKGTSKFKEQTRKALKLTIEKFHVVKRGKNFGIFLQGSVHADMKSIKRVLFQQKTLKSTHSWSNQFWNPIAMVSVTLQFEKTSAQNLTHG